MISWILIGILIFLALLLLKFKEIRHRFGLIVILFLALFLIITATKVYSTNKADLSTLEGIIFAGKQYINWLSAVWKNLWTVGGYAVKQDWAFNVTNST
ncbi:MAG TPA: hypothetical protein VJK51_00660 [Candidatus Nanoarchaeia archaeon]|nr:hypothetical protein [Candidatus Nanoarchaeia archaeon]